MVLLEGFAFECVPDQVSMAPIRLTALLVAQNIKELLTRRQLFFLHLRPVIHPIIWIDAFPQEKFELFG